MMKVIGLTGNIGSGKSAVAHMLEDLGAVHIDADKVAHDIYQPTTAGWHEIVTTFGRDILAADGTVDRRKLARVVFNNPDAIVRLNKIVHPKTREEVERRLAVIRKSGAKAAVVEAILLVEAGWADMMDEIWLVVAPQKKTLSWLKKQRNMSEDEALTRLAAQTPPDKARRYAKQVIENNGTLDDLRQKVTRLWKNVEQF